MTHLSQRQALVAVDMVLLIALPYEDRIFEHSPFHLDGLWLEEVGMGSHCVTFGCHNG